MIQLQTDSKPFSFSILQTDFSNSLSNFYSQGGDDASYVLASDSSKIFLCAISSSFIGVSELKALDVKGKGNFCFDVKVVQGVVKGRNNLEFNYTGSELEFKVSKTKYSGKIVTLPVTKQNVADFNSEISEKVKGTKLTKEVLDSITEAVKLTSVKNVVTKESLNCLISLEGGKLAVSSFDEYHIVLYTSKVDSEDIQFSIYPQTLLSLEKTIGGKFELAVKPNSLRFSTKTTIFVVPTVQAEEEKFKTCVDYLKNLGDETFSASVDSNSFLSVCENLDAIHTVNSQFNLSLNKGLQIQFKTEQGSATDSIDASETKGKGKCGVEPKAFLELLKLHKTHSKTLVTSGYQTVAGMISKNKKTKLMSVVVLTSSES